MNIRSLLIYGGALSSILGMTLFEEGLSLKFAFLSGGVIFVLLGLLKKEKKNFSSELLKHPRHDYLKSQE